MDRHIKAWGTLDRGARPRGTLGRGAERTDAAATEPALTERALTEMSVTASAPAAGLAARPANPGPRDSRDPDARGRHRSSWRRAVGVLIATLALVCGSALVAPSATAAPARVQGARLASFDAQLVSYINQARAAHGAPALTVASGLTSMAVWWSGQQLASNTLKHTANGFATVKKYGAANRLAWGENVGKFPRNASAHALFEAYMHSPEHRANILNPRYRYIGMGTMANGTVGYNTQEFTDKIESASAKKKAAAAAAAKKKAAAAAAAKKKAAAAAKAAKARAAKVAAQKAAAKKAAAKQAARRSAAEQATRSQATEAVSYHHSTAPKPAVTKSASKKSAIKKAAVKKPTGKTSAVNKPAVKKPAITKATAPVVGRLSTSFGALALPGVMVEIRNHGCTTPVTHAKTKADGTVHLSVSPGTYCATVTSAPVGMQRPKPVIFTVTTGTSFSISWSELSPKPAPAPVPRSGFTMRPL